MQEKSYTKKVADHIPSGYCYVIVNENGEIVVGPEVYRARELGEHIVEKMLDELLEHGNRLKDRK